MIILLFILHNQVDGTVLPVAKEHSARYWILLQNYFNRIWAVVSEQTLLVSHWLSKNVFAFVTLLSL